MKTKLSFLALFLVGFVIFGYGQTNKRSLKAAASTLGLAKKSYAKHFRNIHKMGTFTDTIRYPQAKEQLLGASNFFTFDIWKADNEAISQTFLAPASGLKIKGIEFYGSKSTNQTSGTSTSVRAAIYNVDSSNNPVGNPLASGIVSVTTLQYYSVNFGSPISVTGNYAVVITAENTGGVVKLYVNDAQSGQMYDENFCRFKSTYTGYGNVSNWSPIPSVILGSSTYNFEPLVAPIVSYELDTQATLSETSVCLSHDINFTNTTNNPLLSNRMYNYKQFQVHFGQATADETFVWDMDDNSDLIISGNTTYKYLSAGTYSPTLYTVGGFWASCVDSKTYEVTIKPAPTATIVVNGNTLSVEETGTGMTYEWVNCLDNTTVQGANSQSFTPADNASYYAVVSINGCSTTSECRSREVLSVEQHKALSFDLYPNPAEEKINVKGLTETSIVSLLDMNGRVLRMISTDAANTSINIRSFKAGVYFIRIKSNRIDEVRKFIKK